MVEIQGTNQIKICYGGRKNEFHVMIDLDGVLVQWIGAVCGLSNIDINDEDIRAELKAGEYVCDLGIITEEDMWSKIEKEGTEWWENLELFPWTKKLVEEMEKLGQVYFLTSPGECTTAPSGKMAWIKKHFPDYITKFICVKDKWLCAAKNRILIDDSEKKIRKFREYNGHAFLWPNDLKLLDGDVDVDETIEKLKAEIVGYKK